MSCRPVKVRFKQSYNDLVDKPKINGQVLEGDIEIEAGGGVSEIVISTTHAELVALRDAGGLVAGCKYRITDYTTTIAEGIADIEVNGEPFDIIVTALDEKTLSEEASAIQSPNTEYFNGANLAAWKVWYCLDNDADRFTWASEIGKGVIYRLIDEWGNDIPYDFKSIIFWEGTTEEEAGYTLGDATTEGPIIDGSLTGNWRNCVVEGISAKEKDLPINRFLSPSVNITIKEGGSNNKIEGCGYVTLGENCYGNNITSCFGLTIGISSSNNRIEGGDNVSLGNNCIDNIIRGYNISLRDNCNNILIGMGSAKISIGYGCSHIQIGSSGYNITIGNGCSILIFGIRNADGNTLYAETHNIRVDDGVKVLAFNGLPSGKYLQNIEIKSGVYDRVVWADDAADMLYRDPLTTILPARSVEVKV